MELPKAYDPSSVEERRYREWMDAGLFRAEPGTGRPYCITIPPPNITGVLHIGHALNNSIMDCLTRWRRMAGDNVLCLPGTDHAGIATQAVVEAVLAREGTNRHELGREAFVARCWQWREEYGNRIYQQLQRLGCSYDWSRARFTMDEPYVEAIYEEFLRWWDRGLIYRGTRVVNWCPRCSSAISDIEVNNQETQGELYYIRYPFADGDGSITVATTRPETMLGDTAVAVNPADERYAHARGRHVRVPLTDRVVPIVLDDYARADFGTGAVKVTPAHDLDDFEAGLRHSLEQIKVIGDDGRMTDAAGGRYAGLERFECRRRVLEDLKAEGLLERVEPYTIKVPLCDRCKTVLEPLLSEQWFVRQKELAAPAIEAVESGRIRFFPERYARICLDWMRNIRDWCISRQLWWGHRIPVWWTSDGNCAAGRSVEEAAARLGVPPAELRQDEDVLDTWFSSALWPHATLGWPRQTEDLAFWYPTNFLTTAQEILFLWVARMIMTGLDFVGDIPFRDVYVHATVLDERGERMSKSKGNGVDPLDMIARYGADALRFALLQQAGKNQDIRFSEDRVRIAGTFCNKLWNAARFVLSSISPAGDGVAAGIELRPEGVALPPAGRLGLPDRWILSRLQRTVEAVENSLSNYDMDDAARGIYAFVWDEFCDWYLEAAKPRLREGGEPAVVVRTVLAHVLDATLRVLHPLVPHITEEIWQSLRSVVADRGSAPYVMVSRYPKPDRSLVSDEAERSMGLLMECVRGIRNARADFGVAPGAWVSAWIVPVDRHAAMAIGSCDGVLKSLARLSDLTLADAAPPERKGWTVVHVEGTDVFVHVGSQLDVATELGRIGKALAKVEEDMARCKTRLDDPRFLERAPEAVVTKEREALRKYEEERERLLQRRSLLESIA